MHSVSKNTNLGIIFGEMSCHQRAIEQSSLKENAVAVLR